MELIRHNGHILWGRLSLGRLHRQLSRPGLQGLLGWLSRFSLAAALVCLPLHYRWLVQARPQPPLYAEYTNFYLYPADVCLLVTLGLWLARLARGPWRLALKPRLLTFTLAGLWLVTAASSFSSIDPALSIYHALRLLLLFGLYLYLINNPPGLGEVAGALGLLVFIQAGVGLAQVLRQHSLGLAFLQELPLDPSKPGISIVWAEGLRSLRAYGLTDHPNILGGSLAISLLLLAVAYAAGRLAWRPWLAGLFSLGALALLVTFSRSAWLGLLAGLILLLAWALARGAHASLLAWAGLLGGTALVLAPLAWSNAAYLDSRLNLNGAFTQATPENQAIDERSLLVAQAVQIFAGHPLTGVGLAAYPQAFQQQAPDYPFAYQPPHLVLLEAAAETGLPGAAAYLLALAIPWLLLLNGLRRPPAAKPRTKVETRQTHATLGRTMFGVVKDPPLHSPVAARPQSEKTGSSGAWLPLAGISAALLALSLISFLDYYPWLSNPGLLWQWLLWGLWGAWYQACNGENLC